MIDHKPFFKDKTLNKALFEEGYVTLPFLDQSEVEQLKELFWKFHQDSEIEGLHVSAHLKDNDSVQSISDGIQAVFKRAIDEHIENGMTVGGTFITKAANQTECLEPHQDWSIVDESRFRSYTIWVPLEDTTDDNGCMYVLPKSHEYVRGYRHLTVASVFGQIYEVIWKHMTPVHLKAGEAVVFDHALGHASKPNLTDKPRIAATHSLISEDPELRFYWNNNGVVEEYIGEKDFYNTEEAQKGPGRLKKIRDLEFQMHQLTQQEFYTLAGIEPPKVEVPVPSETQEQKSEGGLKGWFKRLVS